MKKQTNNNISSGSSNNAGSSVSSNFEAFDIREYQGQKSNVNRFDYDLFKEENDIIEPMYRVKHSATPKRGERWKIFKNNEIVVELDGSKLGKKECEFLRSLDGARWLLTNAKTNMDGIKNISKLKMTLKKDNKK